MFSLPCALDVILSSLKLIPLGRSTYRNNRTHNTDRLVAIERGKNNIQNKSRSESRGGDVCIVWQQAAYKYTNLKQRPARLWIFLSRSIRGVRDPGDQCEERKRRKNRREGKVTPQIIYPPTGSGGHSPLSICRDQQILPINKSFTTRSSFAHAGVKRMPSSPTPTLPPSSTTTAEAPLGWGLDGAIQIGKRGGSVAAEMTGTDCRSNNWKDKWAERSVDFFGDIVLSPHVSIAWTRSLYSPPERCVETTRGRVVYLRHSRSVCSLRVRHHGQRLRVTSTMVEENVPLTSTTSGAVGAFVNEGPLKPSSDSAFDVFVRPQTCGGFPGGFF